MRRICVFGLACTLSAAGCQPTSTEHRPVGEVAATRLAAGVSMTQSKAPRAIAAARPAAHFRRASVRRAVQRYLRHRPGAAGLLVRDLRTGVGFGYGPHVRFATASVVKVNILAGLLLARQAGRRELTGAERALAERMIRYSDNKAANALYAKVGNGPGLARLNRRLGLRHTVPAPRAWGLTRTCPADQVRLLRALTTARSPLSGRHRGYVLRLMASVIPDQSWGISAATRPGDRFALKNGWVPLVYRGTGWSVNSIGRIQSRDHDFLIAVLSSGQPNLETGIETVEHLARLVIPALRTTH